MPKHTSLDVRNWRIHKSDETSSRAARRAYMRRKPIVDLAEQQAWLIATLAFSRLETTDEHNWADAAPPAANCPQLSRAPCLSAVADNQTARDCRRNCRRQSELSRPDHRGHSTVSGNCGSPGFVLRPATNPYTTLLTANLCAEHSPVPL